MRSRYLGMAVVVLVAASLLIACAADPQKYVASAKSTIFHKTDCRWAKRIKPENLVEFKTRAEAVDAGYRACKVCKP